MQTRLACSFAMHKPSITEPPHMYFDDFSSENLRVAVLAHRVPSLGPVGAGYSSGRYLPKWKGAGSTFEKKTSAAAGTTR